MTTLRGYENRTKELRASDTKSKLFLSVVKPHNLVAPSTIARWLQTVNMEKAGIDTSVFKAHSTRGAATTAAAKVAITGVAIQYSKDFTISRLKMSVLGKLCLPHKRSNSYKLP